MNRATWLGLRNFSAVLALSVAVSSGWAQTDGTQTSPTTSITVTSRLVVLDVVVLDRNNKVVTNLDKSQFTVLEDKVPQTIRNFDPPSGHQMPAGSATAPLVKSSADLPKIGLAPVDVLVFDEVDTPFHQLAYARQMMEKYLRAQPEVLPVPTLFIAAGSTRIGVLHDYTQSRADLLTSIRTHTSDLDFSTVLSSLNGGAGGADNGMVKTLGVLSQLAAALRGVPGRKNVIWVGAGYDRAYDLTTMSELDHNRVLKTIKSVTDRMLNSRVTLYVIDPEGVKAAEPATESSIDPTQVGSTNSRLTGEYGDNLGFESFVTATGGRVLAGRNDLDAQIGQVLTEGTEYYSIGYVPTSANDEARPYRRIRVKVSDPALHVITREGYFGGEAKVSAVSLTKAKQPADVKFDLLNAARTTLVYNGLHMEAARDKDGFTLLVNAGDLHFADLDDGSRRAEVTVVAVFYSAKGKETGQHAAQLTELLSPTDRIVPGARVAFAFPVVMPAFTARVRFVMRDAATATLGSVNFAP